MNKLRVSCYVEGPQDITSQTMHFKGCSRGRAEVKEAVMQALRNIDEDKITEITAEEWHELDVQKETNNG